MSVETGFSQFVCTDSNSSTHLLANGLPSLLQSCLKQVVTPAQVAAAGSKVEEHAIKLADNPIHFVVVNYIII